MDWQQKTDRSVSRQDLPRLVEIEVPVIVDIHKDGNPANAQHRQRGRKCRERRRQHFLASAQPKAAEADLERVQSVPDTYRMSDAAVLGQRLFQPLQLRPQNISAARPDPFNRREYLWSNARPLAFEIDRANHVQYAAGQVA